MSERIYTGFFLNGKGIYKNRIQTSSSVFYNTKQILNGEDQLYNPTIDPYSPVTVESILWHFNKFRIYDPKAIAFRTYGIWVDHPLPNEEDNQNALCALIDMIPSDAERCRIDDRA